MLYYLADYLQRCCDVPGAGVFQYISFRAAAAVIVSLLISLVFGKTWIKYLNKKQVGETIWNLGLEGQLLAIFVIVLAAAEAADALAIALCYYNSHATIDVDQADELKG